MNRRRFMQVFGGSLVTSRNAGESFSSIKNTVNDELRFLGHNNFPVRLILGYYGDGFRLEKEKITVIASRPSVGKSNLMQNLVQDVSMSQNILIGYFSHFRKPLLLDRMKAAQQILVASNVHSATERLTKFNIVIDDTPQVTLNELHTKIESMVRNHNIQLLAIDGFENIYVKNSSTDEAVSIVFSYLNEISQYLKIPILVTIGLNRNLEKRNDKRPRLTDINNYRVIEQSTGSIIYLYRDELYKEDSEYKGLAQITFEHKDGKGNDAILMVYDGKQSCFKNYKPYCLDEYNAEDWA